VGKGVVFDTGGLNLKIRGGMASMKLDMGGAAAAVGAFKVLASTGFKDRLYCVAPLAENAIGPDAYHPGDVITMHSGHTVEINNTDAEGRLLIGDGVSYAARKLKADVVIDAATLTGAQLTSTGARHAAVMTNRHELEEAAVEAGRLSGDLVHPLIFAPEFFMSEFESTVADMRNSVRNRANAQASAAGQFIYNHIDDLDVPWLHVDLAGPAWRFERGTGFGVALLTTLLESLGDLS
jgi:probable aminopeptidase NPEPL1